MGVCSPDTNPTADDLSPPRAARIPPVMAPLPMEFQGSSLSRIAIKAQSKEEYMPPQTAKFPGENVQWAQYSYHEDIFFGGGGGGGDSI